LVTGLAPIAPGAAPIQANDVRAPPIIIRPSISLSEAYTDNPRNTPRNLSDAITHLAGGTAISFDTARLQGQLNGTLDFWKYARATEQDSLGASLLAFGLGTIVREHVFVDARAAITQVPRTGGFGFASPTLIPSSEQSQATLISVTPIVRQAIGDWALGEFRYNYGLSSFKNGGLLSNTTSPSATPSLSSAALADTSQNEATLTVATGPRFGPFGSKLTLDATQVSSQSAAESTQIRAFDDVTYQVNREFTARGRLGYERLRYPSASTADVNGLMWLVGGQFTPSPGTYLELNYGRQDGTNGVNGNLRYQLTPATAITASLQHNRTTSQQLLLANLNTAQLNPNGILVNQITGVPTTLANLEFPFATTTVFLDETAQLGVQTSIGRNSFGLFGFYDHRTPTGTPPGLTGTAAILSGSDTSLGANFNWSRLLRANLTTSAAFGYARELIGHSRTLNADWQLSYTVSEKLTATLHYQFINVSSNAVLGTYYRNQIEIGITRSF
jgi:uncharacterized protein (PEP-CTERM system associated)